MKKLPFLLKNCSISKFLEQTTGPYEADLLGRLERYLKDGGVFLDIGAHIGNHSITLAQRTPAKCIAFEPCAESYQALTANISSLDLGDRVKTRNKAVGASKDTGVLSRIDRNDIGTMSLLGPDDLKGGQEVEIIPLDDLLPDLGNNDVNLIKIDTEGYEVAVIEGARKLIDKFKPVICAECSTQEYFEDVKAIMEKLSYTPKMIYNATPTLIWEHNEASRDQDYEDIIEVFRYAVRMTLRSNSLSLQLHAASKAKSMQGANLVSEYLALREKKDDPGKQTGSSAEIVDKLLGQQADKVITGSPSDAVKPEAASDSSSAHEENKKPEEKERAGGTGTPSARQASHKKEGMSTEKAVGSTTADKPSAETEHVTPPAGEQEKLSQARNILMRAQKDAAANKGKLSKASKKRS